MNELETELSSILKQKFNDSDYTISWTSNKMRRYISFAKSEAQRLSLSLKEYCYYLIKDKTLPGSLCYYDKCKKKKVFRNLSKLYPDYCSHKCRINDTPQSTDEDALIKLIKAGFTQRDVEVFPFISFIEKRSKEFKNVSEYLYYLRNDRKLPNSICACGKKKNFHRTVQPYNEFCSRKCEQLLTEQCYDEDLLMKLLQEGKHFGLGEMNKFRELVKKKVKQNDLFLNNYEYYHYLKNDRTLPNSICACGEKKRFQNVQKPYCEYCSRCAKKIALNDDVRKRIAKNVSKYQQSLTSDDYEKRSNKARRTIANEPLAWKMKKFKKKSESMKRVHKNLTVKEKISRNKKTRRTHERTGYWLSKSQIKTFREYGKAVWWYTRHNDLSVLENIERRGQGPNDFHLDHKYSIKQGFLDNIPVEIIGSIANLEMINSRKNIVKRSDCSITKEELFKLYESV